MKRSILVLLLMFHALPVAAADKWMRVQSKNFTLVGNATENEIREVAEGLEVFRTAFSRFFKLKEGSSIATTVTVFRSEHSGHSSLCIRASLRTYPAISRRAGT